MTAVMDDTAVKPAVRDDVTTPVRFQYEEAFKRNLGLVGEEEQQRLRNATVAIAGAGGAGGSHAVTLARQGVGGFKIADFDTFSLANMNRQAGAFMSTLGKNKARVIRDMVLDINPEARVTVFEEAVTEDNIDAFLDGVDIYADALDFFALEARRLVFGRAREKGIWSVTAGPLGFSAAVLAFSPKGMSFDEYFDLRPEMSFEDRLIAFAVGVTPSATQRPYMDMSRVDVTSGAGPSAGLACQVCSSVVAMETIALLLRRREPDAAPRYAQIDLYRRKYVRGRLWFGNRGPLQRLKRFLFRRHLMKLGVIK